MANKNGKLTIFLIAVLLIVLTFSVTTFAWYTLSDNNKSNVHVQTYDTYSINLADIAIDPILSYGGSVAKDDLQSNGESVVYEIQDSSGTPQPKYNTIDGRIAYVIAKVPMTITNFAGESQTWNITISDFDVYDASGNAVIESTSGTSVAQRIKSDIMLQFIKFEESASNPVTGIHYSSDGASNDAEPKADNWNSVKDDEKPSCEVVINGNGEKAVYVAVAFAVTDDAIDEAYLGMSIKIKATASKK